MAPVVGVIAREAHLSKSVVSVALHGTGRSVLAPTDARRLAEVLGGTATDLNNAESMAAAILPRQVAVWSLGGDDAPDHLAMRATGRRPGDGRGGDLFTGRDRAIDRIRQWPQTVDGPGRALVVTGQPGAGKSSVVARAVRDLEATASVTACSSMPAAAPVMICSSWSVCGLGTRALQVLRDGSRTCSAGRAAASGRC